MSAPDINNPAYSTLNTYSVLASSGITTVNTTTITNGNYGSSPTASYTGTFVGTLDSGNAGTAKTQLTAFLSSITTYIVGLPFTSVIPATLLPNILYITASFTGAITLDAGGNPNAQFFIQSSSSLNFNNVPSITLLNGASSLNVFWFPKSAITFTGTNPPSIPGIFIAGTQITFANASQTYGRLYAQTANITFSGTSSVNGEQPLICYAKGTLILTEEGYVPIENIREGDKVITKGKIINNQFIDPDAESKIEPVIWIGSYKVIEVNSKTRPICIKKDAFGENYPFKDLYVSPHHGVFLNDKMVVAKNIINGDTIYQNSECNEIEYYHLECENHSAIFANGILAESYVDDNVDTFKRSVFTPLHI